MRTLLSITMLVLAIQLQAQHSAKIVTDKMPGTDCDNTAIDEFAGALNRSATPCEIQFDRQVRTALRKAFDKLVTGWSGDWVFDIDNSNADPNPMKSIDRGSENYFYQLTKSDAKDYRLLLNMDPSIPQYREWFGEYSNILDKWRTDPTAEAYQKFVDFNYFVQNATHIKIYLATNNQSERMILLKGDPKRVSVPGAAYAVHAQYVSALTGGAELADSKDAALILFGKPKVHLNKTPDGMTGIEVQNSFPQKTSRLTIQNITIRIECNRGLLDKIIESVDWSILQNLIGK